MQKTQLFNLLPECFYTGVRNIKLPPSIAVLMYHEVLPDEFEIDAWTIVKESDFRRQLEYIVGEFKVISIDQALTLHQNNDLGNEKLVVLTFDDGYFGAASTIKDVAEEFSVPYTVYVASNAVQEQSLYWYDKVIVKCNEAGVDQIDFTEQGLGKYRFRGLSGYRRWQVTQSLLSDLKELEPEERGRLVEKHFFIDDRCPLRFMSVEELGELSNNPLVTIGGHSHCHNRLNQLDPSNLLMTIGKNKELLQQWTNRSVEHFSYPNGDYNSSITKALVGHGYKTAVTTEPGVWKREENLYQIPRYAVGRYDPHGFFKAKLSGVFL